MTQNRTRLWAVCFLLLLPGMAWGEPVSDMRADYREEYQKRTAMKQAAEAELDEARKAALETEKAICEDRDKLRSAIRRLTAENEKLKTEIQSLKDGRDRLESRQSTLSSQVKDEQQMQERLRSRIRESAGKLEKSLRTRPATASDPQRLTPVRTILEAAGLPEMKTLGEMSTLMMDELRLSGKVRTTRGSLMNAAGDPDDGDILVIGNLVSCYQINGSPDHEPETGFVQVSPASSRWFALSRIPDRSIRHVIEAYMKGASDTVPVDLSNGDTLRQIADQVTWKERILSGGPIIWPIFLLLIAAILLGVERVVFYVRTRMGAADRRLLPGQGKPPEDWDTAARVCRERSAKPLARVLAAGIENRHLSREVMENALQEGILREIPPMERFLSTLGMLAGIAPLLGLLGTVTGMINTFHVITLHGTGDPKLMSSGISEALVTTMLGLGTALPIMLLHTLFSRITENRIHQMEEAAVCLVNQMQASQRKTDA